jgi:hypothetical protein
MNACGPPRAIAAPTVEMDKPELRHQFSPVPDRNAVDAVADSQKPARRKVGRKREHAF